MTLNNWTDALQTIESSDIQIVVAWTNAINEMKEVKNTSPSQLARVVSVTRG